MCRDFSNHPKLLFFFQHFTRSTHIYWVNSSLSQIGRYLPFRHLLDQCISLHPMVAIPVQVTSIGCCGLLLIDLPTSKCVTSPPSHSSVCTAAEKSSWNISLIFDDVFPSDVKVKDKILGSAGPLAGPGLCSLCPLLTLFSPCWVCSARSAFAEDTCHPLSYLC